jgi:hypothetical protein
MKVTKSRQNIEKAMQLNAKLRKAEKLSNEIRALRGHFRGLLDPNDHLLIAGRLAVIGKPVPRSTLDRETLKTLITPQQFESLLSDTSYVEIDVKPAIQLAKSKERGEEGTA